MVLIIGAGISGLSAANQLEGEYLILEKEDYIGGLSTRYNAGESGQYWFDFGGHYFHFKDKPEVKTYLEKFSRFKEYKRKSCVFVLNRYIPFPLQYHLSYLTLRYKNAVLLEITNRQGQGAENLQEYLNNNFGRTLFELFFKPFLSKYYNTDLKELAADMDKGSIPVPDKESAAAGAQGKKFSQTGYNPVFYYPRDSLRDFIAAYAAKIKKEQRIKLNEEVVEIDMNRKRVKTKNNHYDYHTLINTMPLKHLLKTIKQKEEFPSYQQLRHISTLVVNIVLKRRRKRLHWVYLPEKQFPFYRAGYYPGRSTPVTYLEKTVAAGSPVNKDELFKEIYFTLKKLQFIEDKREILFFDARIIPVSYILFDKNWHKIVPHLLNNLKKYGIFSTGRYGAWNYTSMSDDVRAAIEMVREIRSAGNGVGNGVKSCFRSVTGSSLVL